VSGGVERGDLVGYAVQCIADCVPVVAVWCLCDISALICIRVGAGLEV
jgi:hypothetical protein